MTFPFPQSSPPSLYLFVYPPLWARRGSWNPRVGSPWDEMRARSLNALRCDRGKSDRPAKRLLQPKSVTFAPRTLICECTQRVTHPPKSVAAWGSIYGSYLVGGFLHPFPMTREPYRGKSRKLVLAFDIGTTYSGAAYAFLDPGEVPEINSVTK